MPPFTETTAHIARSFQHLWNHHFAGGLKVFAAAVARHAGAETVAACEKQRAGRPAKRGTVAMLETNPAPRERVKPRRLEIIGAVTTEVPNAQIIRQNKDKVR